jgi:hypothetical protein
LKIFIWTEIGGSWKESKWRNPDGGFKEGFIRSQL